MDRNAAIEKMRSTRSNKDGERDHTDQMKNHYANWLSTRQAEKQIRCDICKLIFSEKDIWSHVEIHIGASKVQHDKNVIPLDGGQHPKQGTSTRTKLNRSTNRNKGDGVSYMDSLDTAPPVSKPHCCPVCKKRYTQKHNLTVHLKYHKACRSQTRPSENRFELRMHRHIKNTHTIIGEKPFKCGSCNSSYSQKGSLSRHLLIHSGNRPFTCDICKRTYRHKSTIVKHMKVHIVSGRKPFKCVSCNSSYSQKGSLSRHLLTHSVVSGSKPFNCDICNQSFRRKDSIRNHMYVHIGEKPFKCGSCDKSYSNKSSLSNHLLRHNGNKPFTCDICKKSFWRKESIQNHVTIHIIG